MQQFGFGFLGHLEDQPAVGRMAPHDGDEDHPVGGEVALMQPEGGGCCPGWIEPRRFLLHKTTDAVRSFLGRELLGEACRRFGTAVSVANKRAHGYCVDDVVADMISHPECESSHSSY